MPRSFLPNSSQRGRQGSLVVCDGSSVLFGRTVQYADSLSRVSAARALQGLQEASISS